jgi:hypothetical protein
MNITLYDGFEGKGFHMLWAHMAQHVKANSSREVIAGQSPCGSDDV